MSVITISRQFGAGGKTLGGMISKKLGYNFFDNDLIQMVAKKAKVSTNWVESLEKEAGGRVQRFIQSVVPKSMIDRILDDKRGYIDEEIYVDTLNEIIRQIADEGNAVILGRGSQYILKDHADTYHLLLIAEKEDRVQFMEKHYKLTPGQAIQAVNNEDKRRMNLYRKFGKKDYDQPDLYHLVFNMSKTSLDTACGLICDLASIQLQVPNRPSTSEESSDVWGWV